LVSTQQGVEKDVDLADSVISGFNTPAEKLAAFL
jgi:hypothetical protein